MSLIFSAFSVGFSLKVLLPHQAEKLIELNWPHWMSWFVSYISIVLESAILNLLFFAFMVPMFQDMIFDATLKAQGLGDLLDDTEDIPRLVIIWRNLKSSVLVTWLLIMAKVKKKKIRLSVTKGSSSYYSLKKKDLPLNYHFSSSTGPYCWYCTRLLH